MGKSDPNNGRCATCGFLALRHNPYEKGEHFTELDQERRDRGNIFHVFVKPGDYKPAEPICLQSQRISFSAEMGDQAWRHRHERGEGGKDNPSWTVALKVIQQDRGCRAWKSYRPGLPPSTFLGLCMITEIQVELEKDRKRWESRMEEKRRRWERESEQDRREYAEQISAKEDKREESRRKFERWIMIWLAIIAAVIAVGGIVVDVLITSQSPN